MNNRINSSRPRKARPQSAKTGVINLTDLMRIQREIIPSINEEKNRRLYEQKLKENSNAHILKFKGDGIRIDTNNLGYYYDKIKNEYIDEELRKRQIDEIEKEFFKNEKKTVNDRAKKIAFQNQDDIKEFRSKMLVSDCMNERKYQQEIKNLQKATNDFIEEKYYAQDLENMAKYDKKEKEKNDLMQKKKREQMRIIKDQMEEAKIKKIQEFQEREIEGFMARQDYLDGLKEDEIKAEKEKEGGAEHARISHRDRVLRAGGGAVRPVRQRVGLLRIHGRGGMILARPGILTGG